MCCGWSRASYSLDCVLVFIHVRPVKTCTSSRVLLAVSLTGRYWDKCKAHAHTLTRRCLNIPQGGAHTRKTSVVFSVEVFCVTRKSLLYGFKNIIRAIIGWSPLDLQMFRLCVNDLFSCGIAGRFLWNNKRIMTSHSLVTPSLPISFCFSVMHSC